jgi:[ribosomal protein S5]-alanine N-acetyltransferase
MSCSADPASPTLFRRLDEMSDQPAFSYPSPPLSDGIVVLRRWEEGDLDCVEQAAEDPDIPKGTTVPATFTPAEGRAWIERQWSRAESGTGLSQAIAEAASGEALGAGVLMTRQRSSAEIGFWLVPRARGRGIGSRAVRLLARWAVKEAGLARVEAFVIPDNIASQRVLEKAGFRREGLLRSHLSYEERRFDALLYSLLPSDLA